MERVHRVLGHLQPVAGVVDEVGHELDAGERKSVEHRELGHELRGAEVGEDESGELPNGIGAVAELAGDGAFGRLGGRLQDGAVHVEQPAVVAAADAALGDDSVLERRPAVAAMLVQEANRPERSRNSTSSSPSTLTRMGRSASCPVIANGIQKRRKYSPHGVPGPVWVSSGSSRASETRWYPL